MPHYEIEYAHNCADFVKAYGRAFQLCTCGSMRIRHVRQRCLYAPSKFTPARRTLIRSRGEYSNDGKHYETIVESFMLINRSYELCDSIGTHTYTEDLDHYWHVGFKAFTPQRR